MLYEIDDYGQSARKVKSHELSDIVNAEFVRQMELSMHVADGMTARPITSHAGTRIPVSSATE